MAECLPYYMERASMGRTYEMRQENGQRKYGPPTNWKGPAPPKGTEVFVAKIPRDLFEDELIPVFEKIGSLYEFRLMMSFSGSNRGFAFVRYTNIEDAKRAIKELDNYEIRKNKYIGVCKSTDNRQLFIKGIPKNLSKEEIQHEMCRVTDGVTKVVCYQGLKNNLNNRGFAFVEYQNHVSAVMCMRNNMLGKKLLWGRTLDIDWAQPEPEVDESIMENVKVLFVRNLSPRVTEGVLKKCFSLQNSLQVREVKKRRGFAFVHYVTRQDAETALLHFQNFCIDNAIIEVTWAKPADKSNRGQKPPSSPGSSSYNRRRNNFSAGDPSDVESP